MLVLSRRDVLDLLTLRDCIDAVEAAFRLHGEGRSLGPGVLGVPAGDGGFHISPRAREPTWAFPSTCGRIWGRRFGRATSASRVRDFGSFER